MLRLSGSDRLLMLGEIKSYKFKRFSDPRILWKLIFRLFAGEPIWWNCFGNGIISDLEGSSYAQRIHD